MSDDRYIKHLEFIQAAIQRLSSFSFAYKGWAITIVGATLALSGAERHAAAVIVLLPILGFALLDAFYLRQERLFRRLFNEAAAGRLALLSMDVTPFSDTVPSTIRLVFTPAIFTLYGMLGMLSLIVWWGS